MSSAETTFIPAFRGYERVGQFPLDKTSSFSSHAEAELYASRGLTRESSAYPGQIISISEKGKITVCAIDPNYKLVGITSTTTTDSSTYMEFSYEALNISSGVHKIILEKGSFLKTITVQIVTPFTDKNGNLTDIAFFIGGPIIDGQIETYIGKEDLLTSEEGHYMVYINSLLKEELTEIIIYANPIGVTTPFTNGYAILKIN